MQTKLLRKSFCVLCCLVVTSFFTKLSAQETVTVWVTSSGTYDAETFSKIALFPVQTKCQALSGNGYNDAVSEITGGLSSRIFKIGDPFNIPEGYVATEVTIYGWPRRTGSTYMQRLTIDGKTTEWTAGTTPYTFADCGADANDTNRTKDNCSVYKIAEISEDNPVTSSFSTPVSRETNAFYKIVLKRNEEVEQIPAFPGAEGGGMYTTGGRGGRVVKVTNLDDSAPKEALIPGSLRWALNQPSPKTIVFEVSGTIRLKDRIDINEGNITIAGQTAPGDGICLADNFMSIKASNVIIRYMRFRMGDLYNIENDVLGARYQSQIIIDHCSMSWSTDECASFYDNENLTLQWSILSESLRISAHAKGPHGYGAIWGGIKVSFHHNLLAHHDSRNPRFAACTFNGADRKTGGLLDYRNNVVYDWGNNSGYGGEGGRFNMINNYYQPGSDSKREAQIYGPSVDSTGVYGTYHVTGNIMMNKNGTVNTSVTNNNWNGISLNSSIGSDIRTDTKFEHAPVTTHEAQKAYEQVLAYAGASYKRDAIDTRIVDEVERRLSPRRAFYSLNPRLMPKDENGNAFRATLNGMIDTQEDVGGWCDLSTLPAPVDTDGDGMPDEWEAANGLNPDDPSDGSSKSLSGRTYTNLEMYINGLVEDITMAQNEGGVLIDGRSSSDNISYSKTKSSVFAYTSGNTLYLNNLPDCRIEVYSINGLFMAGKKVSGGETLFDLSSGIYIVRIISNDNLESLKTII